MQNVSCPNLSESIIKMRVIYTTLPSFVARSVQRSNIGNTDLFIIDRSVFWSSVQVKSEQKAEYSPSMMLRLSLLQASSPRT